MFRANRLLLAMTTLVVACQHIPAQPLSPPESAAALAGRTLSDPQLRAFLEAARGAPLAVWPPRRWDFESLSLAAIYYHPDLAVARARAEVSDAAIQSAGARPNPVLSVAPEWSSNPGAGVSPWLAAVQLDWPLETAGKRSHRIERARAGAAAARRDVISQAWRVRCETATSLVAELAARRRCASLGEEVEATRHLAALVDDRVATGAASATDAAPLHAALLQSAAESAAVCAALPELEARLAASLGVGPAALAAVDLAPLPPADLSPLSRLPAEEARGRALLERSDVLAMLDGYAASEAALRLELARQYPDLHLGTGYQFDQGQNKWALGLSLELPVLNQNQGPIAEAVAARAEAATAFVATQAAVIAEVERALARRAGARARFEDLCDLAAERGENLRRVRSALRLGAADRAAEVAAQLEALRAARAAGDAEMDLQQALLDLDCAVQDPFVAARWIEQPRADSAGEEDAS
jgi:outer membrane protein TolC